MQVHKPKVEYKLAEISVSPGDRRKSPSSRPWRAGYSDPNKKIEGKYYNCGVGNSRMRSEHNKIVEAGIKKKLRRETILKKRA